MRPNNSKIIYNSSLRDNSKNGDLESPHNKRSIKFINKNQPENSSNENLSIDPNWPSQPSTPTSPRNSPRHYRKKRPCSPLSIPVRAGEILDFSQPAAFRSDAKGGEGTGSAKTQPKQSSSSGNQRHETTDALVSKRARSLLRSGDDGSSDSDEDPRDLRDNQGSGGSHNDVSLFNFIKAIGNIIVDNFERTLGRQSSRHKKQQNLDINDFKFTDVKQDEIVGFDDDNDDYGSNDIFGFTGKGKTGAGGPNEAKYQVNMNGLTKDEEEKIIKQFEKGGEIPKGYTVLVGKDGQ